MLVPYDILNPRQHMSHNVADVGALDHAPMFLPSEHFTPGLTLLSNDPSPPKRDQQPLRGDASDSTDYSTPESDRSAQLSAEKWNAVYDAHYAPTPTKQPGSLPHETTGSQSRADKSFMSWWPVPDINDIHDDFFIATDGQESQPKGHEANNRRPSIFSKLEHSLHGFLFGTHGLDRAKATPNGDTKSPVPVIQSGQVSDSLFHVVLTTSHLEKDVNSTVQGVRVCSTFDSLAAAKAYAHRCLFELGYEKEWFAVFKTQHDLQLVDHKQDRIVEATGPEGEVFTIDISTTPNIFGLKSNNETKRLQNPFYHVVQTIIHYRDDSSGQTRDTTIQGSFPTYDRARQVAHSLLLWWEEGIDKNTYAQYEEAGPGELDCGYGDNVVVHAVGQNGENFLVSVLKGEQTETERVMEAASGMR